MSIKPLSVPIKLNSIKTWGISLTNPISLMITEFTSSAISINDLPRRPCNRPLLQASQLVKSLLKKSQSCRTRPRCRTTPPTSWAPPRCPRRSSWAPPSPPPPTAMSTRTPCSSDSSNGAVFDFQMFLWYPTMYSCRRNIWNSPFPNISVTSTSEPFFRHATPFAKPAPRGDLKICREKSFNLWKMLLSSEWWYLWRHCYDIMK